MADGGRRMEDGGSLDAHESPSGLASRLSRAAALAQKQNGKTGYSCVVNGSAQIGPCN